MRINMKLLTENAENYGVSFASPTKMNNLFVTE